MSGSARLSASERLARFRKRDSLLDALLSGSVTSGNGASNDRMLMERLLYRCFSLPEIVEIMGGYQNGDTAARQAMGDAYCRDLRRSILRGNGRVVDRFRTTMRAPARARARSSGESARPERGDA